MKFNLMLLALACAAVQIRAQAQVQVQAADGKTLFAKNCAACHQASGLGIPGAFPALKGDALVQADPAIVIATVLKGRAGMPSFAASLDDDKLGAIITYARGAWGNRAGAVTTAEVAAVRNASSAAAATQEKGTIIH